MKRCAACAGGAPCAARNHSVMVMLAGYTWRTVEHWDRDATMPVAVKVAAALSIVFWFGVVFFGRAIGFTLGIFGS